MSEPANLARIRAALARLDALAKRTPGLASGPPTPDEIAALAADLEEVMSPEKHNERLGIRVSPELRERIESYRLRLAAELPAGLKEPNLSDAARMLILKGLEVVDG